MDQEARQEQRQERILVLDDDPALRALLVRYLGEQGFQVVAAADTRAADAQLARHHVDLLVLDLTLPGEDGLAYCRRLRAREGQQAGAPMPVVMLTARGDEVDRIVGLELGADDYLPKPFNPRELLARIRAVLRRRSALPASLPQPELGPVRFGACTLDPVARTLTRGQRTQRLTSGEFALLSVFVRHPRQPLTRDRLLTLAHDREAEPFERSIDVTVSRLRRLIEADPKQPRHLQTVWGVGYVFVPDDSP